MSSGVRYYNLEAAMFLAGVKKADLAELLDLSIPTIYTRFKGTTDFSFKEALEIRDYLTNKIGLEDELTLEYLFEETDEKQNVTEE